MTKLGEFLLRRQVNKALLARTTGLTTSRIRDLTLKPEARPMGFEIYLIALAIDADLNDLAKTIYSDLKLDSK